MALPNISKTRKFLSTLLTFWIPFKARRRAYRGIIQLGVRRYFNVLKTDKTKHFKYELAIGAITKNEGPYIKEWIDYHILVGVQKFYIYDNESTDETAKILKPYIKKGIVEYVYFPGSRMQNAAFIDIINKHCEETRWLAPIDLDEFLVPVKHKSLPEFLHTLPGNAACVIASWVLYGSSGHKTKPEGLIIENYKYRRKKPAGCKSIINPRLIVQQTNAHVNFFAGYIVDCNGKKLGRIDQSNNPPSIELLRCNHYKTKSYQEYVERCERGGGYSGNSRKEEKFARWDYYNQDNVYDDIMDKYIEQLKDFKL